MRSHLVRSSILVTLVAALGACAAGEEPSERTSSTAQRLDDADAAKLGTDAASIAVALMQNACDGTAWCGVVVGAATAFSDLLGVNDEVDQVKAEVAQMQTRMDHLQGEIDGLQDEIEGINLDLETLRSDLELEISQASGWTEMTVVDDDRHLIIFPAIRALTDNHVFAPPLPVGAGPTLQNLCNQVDGVIAFLEGTLAGPIPIPDPTVKRQVQAYLTNALTEALATRLLYIRAGFPTGTSNTAVRDWLDIHADVLARVGVVYGAGQEPANRFTSLRANADDPIGPVRAAADFTGDGIPDLLTHDPVTGDVRITTLDSSYHPVASVWIGQLDPVDDTIAGAGDFDHDGKTDILLATPSDPLHVWRMNRTVKIGEAGISQATPVPIQDAPGVWIVLTPLAVGDFDGDGWADVADGMSTLDMSASIETGIAPIGVLQTKSLALSWQNWWQGGYGYPQRIAGAGDFNRDGRADLVAFDRTTSEVTISFASGATSATVTTTAIARKPALRTTRLRAVADFDRDGYADLYWQDVATGNAELWLMSGTSVRSVLPLSRNTTTSRVRVRNQLVDFTGDKLVDYADHDYASGSFYVHDNRGLSCATYPAKTVCTPKGFSPVGANWTTGRTASGTDNWAIAGQKTDVMLGDFDGDGRADYLDHDSSTGAMTFHKNLGTLGFGAAQSVGGATCTGDCDVLVGDFTGDGLTDYADHDLTNGNLYVHENLTKKTGTMQFAPVGTNYMTGKTCSGFCDVFVGDFDGDGYADYADHDGATGAFYVHQNVGTYGGRVFSSANWSTGQGCPNDGRCEELVGDFDGDKRADYADHDVDTGTFWVHLNRGAGNGFDPPGTNWLVVSPTAASPTGSILGFEDRYGER